MRTADRGVPQDRLGHRAADPCRRWSRRVPMPAGPKWRAMRIAGPAPAGTRPPRPGLLVIIGGAPEAAPGTVAEVWCSCRRADARSRAPGRTPGGRGPRPARSISAASTASVTLMMLSSSRRTLPEPPRRGICGMCVPAPARPMDTCTAVCRRQPGHHGTGRGMQPACKHDTRLPGIARKAHMCSALCMSGLRRLAKGLTRRCPRS